MRSVESWCITVFVAEYFARTAVRQGQHPQALGCRQRARHLVESYTLAAHRGPVARTDGCLETIVRSRATNGRLWLNCWPLSSCRCGAT